MLFRRLLVLIRKWYNTDLKKTVIKFSAFFLACVLAGLAADIFLPFDGAWNVLRSFILAPTAFTGFVLSYLAALSLHDYQVRNDPKWTAFRARFSPTWRRRVAMIAGAVLLVLVYAVGFRPGYTLISSGIVIAAAGLFAFIRLTQKEFVREELSAIDPRDIEYNRAIKKRQAAAREKAESRIKQSKIRRTRIIKGKKYADEFAEELEAEEESVKSKK